MDKDPNIMPKFDLFPRLERVGRVIGNLLTPFHTSCAPFMSTHNRGGGTALDAALYDQPQLDFEAQADVGW